MNAAEDDDLGIGFRRLLGEAEGIAYKIRHILNLRHLIIVREDHGIELLLKAENFLRERRELVWGHRPARLHVCDINHASKLPRQAAGVNEAGTAPAIGKLLRCAAKSAASFPLRPT